MVEMEAPLDPASEGGLHADLAAKLRVVMRDMFPSPVSAHQLSSFPLEILPNVDCASANKPLDEQVCCSLAPTWKGYEGGW